MINCVHMKEIESQFKRISSIPLTRIKVLAECVTCNLPKPHLWFCIGCWYKNEAFFCLDHFSSHKSIRHRIFYSFKESLLHCAECSYYIPVSEVRSKKARKIIGRLEKLKTHIVGQTGLVNLGNSCYMNVAIQCLNSLPSISKFFLELSPYYSLNEHSENTIILRSFQKLVGMMWDDDLLISPSAFASKFFETFTFFRPRTQQDAQEFIRQLLDSLHSSLLDSGFSTTVIDRTFTGVLEKEVTCKNCGFKARIDEQVYELSLPLPDGDSLEESSDHSFNMMENPDKQFYKKKDDTWIKRIKKSLRLNSRPLTSLYDCLISFFKPEEIDDNTVYCEHCDEYSHRKINYTIKEFPNIFIVVLKRFKYTRRCVKVSSHVQMPLNLRLSDFAKDKKDLCDYELSAIIEHLGTFNRGHYRAFIRHFGLQSWFKFNDSKVKPVSQAKILNAHPYIAFYTRVGIEKTPEMPKAEEVFIPKEWMFNYYLLQNPGSIESKKFVCEHGKFNPKVTSEILHCTTTEEFNRMREIYGSDAECLTSDNICEVCVQQCRAPEGVDLDKKIISKIEDEHRELFVISNHWFEIWKKFFLNVPSSSMIQRPSTIRNGHLLEDGIFNHKLEIGVDYFMVDRETWTTLQSIYGTDFEIKMHRGQYFVNLDGMISDSSMIEMRSFSHI